MKSLPNWLKIQLLIIIGLIVFNIALWAFRTGDHRIQQAEENYAKGEQATTIAARKEAFNDSLDLFLKLDSEYHPEFGTGKLQYNIGNTYFQLGEYPLSILYYKRAEKLMPRSEIVKRNLSQAYAKAGLKIDEKYSGWMDALLMKSILSLSERIQIFFAFSFITLILTSAWLWTKGQWASKIGVLFLLLSTVMLINLIFSYYFSPVEGVLVQAAELRRDAGMEFAKVGEEPILGGTTIEIVGTSPNGKWLKVIAPNGDFGYLPRESLKLE